MGQGYRPTTFPLCAKQFIIKLVPHTPRNRPRCAPLCCVVLGQFLRGAGDALSSRQPRTERGRRSSGETGRRPAKTGGQGPTRQGGDRHGSTVLLAVPAPRPSPDPRRPPGPLWRHRSPPQPNQRSAPTPTFPSSRTRTRNRLPPPAVLPPRILRHHPSHPLTSNPGSSPPHYPNQRPLNQRHPNQNPSCQPTLHSKFPKNPPPTLPESRNRSGRRRGARDPGFPRC